MTDVSMNVFPMNLIHIGDLILFAHQFCRYVEHFLQGEICCIHNGILIVLEILSHDDTTDGVLAIRFIIGFDFAVTRSSPESCCDRFAVAAEQTVELKWLMLNNHNK